MFPFRLARKEEVASTVVQSLRILLAMKPGSIFHVSKQASRQRLVFAAVLRIRIRNRIRIHMFLGLPDPDPLVTKKFHDFLLFGGGGRF